MNNTDGKVDILDFFLGFVPLTNTTGEGLNNFLLEKPEIKDIGL